MFMPISLLSRKASIIILPVYDKNTIKNLTMITDIINKLAILIKLNFPLIIEIIKDIISVTKMSSIIRYNFAFFIVSFFT